MKTALAIVTLSGLLMACASAPPLAPSADKPSANSNANADNKVSSTSSSAAQNSSDSGNDEDSVKSVDSSLPQVELTNEIMFKILGSEFAMQRGQWQTGYVTLQALAQQTRDPRLAKRAVEMALAAKQLNEALTAVRLWRELAPQSDEAAQYFLALTVMHDKLSEALPIFAQRLQAAPVPARGSLILSTYQRYLSQAKDKALLFSQLETLYAPYQDVLETHLVLAQAAVAKGDQARARDEAKKALAIKPDSELALMTYVYLLENPLDGQKVVAEFLQKYPQSKDTRQSWARMLLDRKQYEAAREQYEILAKDKAHEVGATLALGRISLILKDYDAGEKHLKHYMELLGDSADGDQDTSRVVLWLSQIAEERGDMAAAIRWLEQIKNTDSNNYLTAISRHAQILAKQNKMEEARSLLHAATTTTDQEKAQLLQLEAQLLRDANQVLEAFAFLSEALKSHPNSAELLYDRAMLAEKLDRMSVMESDLRKVIQISPENQHAYNALGYSLAERNLRLPEAQTLIEKALKMAPEDPFILDSMGWVQYRMGKLKEAEATLRRAYTLRPDAEIAVHLGEVLWKSGQNRPTWTGYGITFATLAGDAGALGAQMTVKQRVLRLLRMLACAAREASLC
ncbi:MAG: tetratricopeptide repeat protein [Burkholderiales bacterium]|nr:tetratricopeptide repeat protein [Burkholderiales bacterium]